MQSTNSIIFTPCKIGPVELRNRTIRSAAFENMCKDNYPTQQLFDYHTAVARGGIGMTTVAYASVNRSGVSFDGQLWMRKEIVPELKKLTDAVHKEGAKASIQLGHCGNITACCFALHGVFFFAEFYEFNKFGSFFGFAGFG